jgi:hypothetical protein
MEVRFCPTPSGSSHLLKGVFLGVSQEVSPAPMKAGKHAFAPMPGEWEKAEVLPRLLLFAVRSKELD